MRFGRYTETTALIALLFAIIVCLVLAVVRWAVGE